MWLEVSAKMSINNSDPPFGDARFLEEVNIPRVTTTSYIIEKKNAQSQIILAIHDNLNLLDKVSCVQTLVNKEQTIFEITYTNSLVKIEADNLLNKNILSFEGQIIRKVDNRELKGLQKIPFVRVMIYESPYELENSFIIRKLQKYGELVENSAFMHKIRGTQIDSGIRSIKYRTIHTPIPTTLFIRGNKIKLKHEGQDRTPYCSTCSTRGHYRDDCPALEQVARSVNEDELPLEIPEDHKVQDSWAKAVENEERKRNQSYRRFTSEEETKRLNQILEDNQQEETEQQQEMDNQTEDLKKSDIENSEDLEVSEVESNVTTEDLDTLTQRLEDLEKTLGREGFEKRMDEKLKKLKVKQWKKKKKLKEKIEKVKEKKGDSY